VNPSSRLRLSPSASITPTAAGVVLRSDLGAFAVTGADLRDFLDRIVPLLDGTRDLESITTALGRYSPKSVASFLGLLAERGLVEEVRDSAASRWAGQEAFFRRFSRPAEEAMAALASARVLVAGAEPWGVAIARSLAQAGVGGIRLAENMPWEAAVNERWTLVIGAVPPRDTAMIERVARFAHRADTRSLWAHLAGHRLFLGPLTAPGKTACRMCAAVEALNPALDGAAESSPERLAVMTRLLGDLTAAEAVKAISGYTPSKLGGQVVIRDLVTHESRSHNLVKLPWCRVCGR
jgi:hypothetical protein